MEILACDFRCASRYMGLHVPELVFLPVFSDYTESPVLEILACDFRYTSLHMGLHGLESGYLPDFQKGTESPIFFGCWGTFLVVVNIWRFSI